MGHYGLGFLVLHRSRGAAWLLLNWWSDDNIMRQLLSRNDGGGDDFQAVLQPYHACVWESVVLTHERDAWVRHMLNGRPDAAAYQGAVLPPGLY